MPFTYRHMHKCTYNLVDSGFHNNFIFLACKEISFYCESDHIFDKRSMFRDIEARYFVMVGDMLYE